MCQSETRRVCFGTQRDCFGTKRPQAGEKGIRCAAMKARRGERIMADNEILGQGRIITLMEAA